MKNKHFSLWLLLSIFFMAALYLLYLRGLVELAYAGEAPSWFHSLINSFYPRFEVEKQRFSLSFFLSKTDQILLRFSIIATALSIFIYFFNTSVKFRKKVNHFWDQSVPVRRTAILRVLFFFLMLVIFKDIYWDLMSWGKAAVFYKPILPYKILHLSFPSETEILFLYIVLIISCLACIFNFQPFFFSIIAVADFILIQGYIFGFEKTDHGFATFTYAGILMPLLIWQNRKAIQQNKVEQTGWTLQLIITVICLCYFFSGLEKLLISKLEWLRPDTFKAYLLLHETRLGLKVYESGLLSAVLPVFTLAFQLGFILILFYKKARWIFIPAGILFHISSYLLFDIGGFTNPWMLTYIFFIDWERLVKLNFRKST